MINKIRKVGFETSKLSASRKWFNSKGRWEISKGCTIFRQLIICSKLIAVCTRHENWDCREILKHVWWSRFNQRMHAGYLFVCIEVESGFLSRWTARGTKVKPRVWRRPKLTDEGVESEVLNLETAETRPSMVSSSTSIELEASFFCKACLRWFFCLCFLDGWAFLKNSNEVGNLCLSTRCCCRLL